MKTISASLKEAFETLGTVAFCLKITRTDGVVVGFTEHDVPLTVGAVTYNPLADLQRIVMKMRSNLEVSNQEFVAAFSTGLRESDIGNGIYDECALEAFYVNWQDTSLGGVTVFPGLLGNIQWNKEGLQGDIYNLVYLLEASIGTIVTPKCRHLLFSQIGDTSWQVGSCKLNKASFTYSSSVSAITTQKLKFTIGAIGQPDNWIQNGVLTWTSGNNNGASYEVKSFVSNVVELFLPTNFNIAVSDTFDVTAGCDKTLDTCRDKFSNVINFGAFPFSGEDE